MVQQLRQSVVFCETGHPAALYGFVDIPATVIASDWLDTLKCEHPGSARMRPSRTLPVLRRDRDLSGFVTPVETFPLYTKPWQH